MKRLSSRSLVLVIWGLFVGINHLAAQEAPDFLRELHLRAVEDKQADWIQWGDQPSKFSNWTNHSNRLIPVYTFGISLDSFKGENSLYRSEEKVKQLYGKVPEATVSDSAEYFDQTDVYRLQQEAFAAGKKNVILIVFDGMDWQTTQAAAIYKNKKVVYTEGRGTGLAFLDYDRANTDFGYCVTSPHHNDSKKDVNGQVLTEIGGDARGGGYCGEFGGPHPWSEPGDPSYLLSHRKSLPHLVTDSAASATSINAGVKTYNAAINVDAEGKQVTTIARQMQEQGRSIGVVTSVPISHATPACAYANNVTRNDYQDLTRDLLGRKSAAHRDTPLPGVDVLIGCGWGEASNDDRNGQGQNYVPGNKYLAADDLAAIDVRQGGKYVVAQRTHGEDGNKVLQDAAALAVNTTARLFGFFGVGGGHLPFQTADGKFDPTRGVKKAERYSQQDISENPTLAEMTTAALTVLESNEQGFWLMIESGDVDWANHNNNIDDSIGAVLSGEAAFEVVVDWVERRSNWDESAVILTADHGHMLRIKDLEALTGKRPVAEPKKVESNVGKLEVEKGD